MTFKFTDLEDDLCQEDSSERVVELTEDEVVVGVKGHGVLHGEFSATGEDDDDDEPVEPAQVDEKVAEFPGARGDGDFNLSWIVYN